MGNSKYTLTDCAQAMRARKYQEEARMRKEQQLDDGDEIENASAAWYAAQAEFERMIEQGKVPGYFAASRIATTTTSKPKAPESEVAPRKLCTEHVERVHKFSDGSSIACCSHSFCNWGYGHEKNERLKFSKKHSDGLPGGVYAEPVEPGDVDDVEVEASEVEELHVIPVQQAPVAGKDDDDVESSLRNIADFFGEEDDAEEEPEEEYASADEG